MNINKTLFLLLGLMLYAVSSEACTNFIVGKKASVNGSVICTYNADSYGMFLSRFDPLSGSHA